MGIVPEGKTEAQGRKGKTSGLSSIKTGVGNGHSESRHGAGKSYAKTGFSAKAAAMGRGKQSRS